MVRSGILLILSEGGSQVFREKPGIKGQGLEGFAADYRIGTKAVIAAIAALRADTAQMGGFRLIHIDTAFLAGAAHEQFTSFLKGERIFDFYHTTDAEKLQEQQG